MKFLLYRLISKKILFFLASILSVFIILMSNTKAIFASTELNLTNKNSTVIEYLRLSVNKYDKEAWLKAEKNSWEPWLKDQKGFLGREIFWDPQKEEGMLLISWASRKDWKNIPQTEIDDVQELFEKLARGSSGRNSVNPFPIKEQGELLPQ